MCKEVGVGDINLAYNSLYLIEVFLCLLCSGLYITATVHYLVPNVRDLHYQKPNVIVLDEEYTFHRRQEHHFSFLSLSFSFLYILGSPSLIHRSLYISVSAWGEEKKWSRQEIYPSERQVWINKEEVYSALPKRESWRETREGFFFLKAAVRFWEDNEQGRKKVKRRKSRGEGTCWMDGW